MFDFNNKAVIVTGGNSGIGKACALMFGQYGANVVIAARREIEGEAVVDEIKSQGGEAIFIKTDVASVDSIRAMTAKTINQYSAIDFAINNAGVVGKVKTPLADFTEDDFDMVMDINVKGVFIAMQLQLKQMMQQKAGVIINMSSVAGLRAGRASSIYTTSKHAVVGMTRAAAKEYAPHGIRVNAICPALVETPMIVDAKFYNGKPISESIPVGRLGHVEEVASACCWLCSDLAAYTTGVSLPIDGGILS